MKNLISLALLVLVFTSCGGSRNFNRQKYTTLKQIDRTTEPAEKLAEESADTYVEPMITSNPIQAESNQENISYASEVNTAIEEETANLRPLSDSETVDPYEDEFIDEEASLTTNAQEQTISKAEVQKEDKNEEGKSTRKKGWSLVILSLIAMFSVLGIVIAIGGINLLLVLGVALGVVLLVWGLLLLVKGARQNKEKKGSIFRSKVIFWIVMAAVAFGLGFLVTLLTWVSLPMIIALILTAFFLGLSFHNFIQMLKEKNGDVPPSKKRQGLSLLLFLSTFGFIFLMLVTIPFSQILFALCLLAALFVFISSFVMLAKAYKGVA